MYVSAYIYIYTSVLAICPPWPEVPASMPRSDSRNLSGKGSKNISGISGTNGIRFSLRRFHSKSKFRNGLTQTKEALGVGRSRHRDEMIAAGEIDAGLLKNRDVDVVDQKLQGSTSRIFLLRPRPWPWQARLAVVEFFWHSPKIGLKGNGNWSSNRSDSRGGRSWQQKMYDFWQHQVLCWHRRRFMEQKHTWYIFVHTKGGSQKKIIKNKQTFGVRSVEPRLVVLMGFFTWGSLQHRWSSAAETRDVASRTSRYSPTKLVHQVIFAALPRNRSSRHEPPWVLRQFRDGEHPKSICLHHEGCILPETKRFGLWIHTELRWI